MFKEDAQINEDLKIAAQEENEKAEIFIPENLSAEEMTGDKKTDAQITELSKAGYKFLKEENEEDAISAFLAILELDPKNNYALVGLGDANRKRHNYADAINYYQKCLDLMPNNSYALFGLADCYKAMNLYTKAIQIWELYLNQDPKNITILTRVADAYRKLRIFKHSKEIYSKVLEIDNTNPYALIGLGHLFYDYREYREALDYWTQMYDLNKESCDIRVLTSIGNCHRKLKTYGDGIQYFELALEREPRNFYALFGLADCYRGLGQHKKSIEYWNRILEIDGENKVILTRAGDAYRNLGDFEKAEKYYTTALDIDFDTYAALGLALLCKDSGKYEEAIERLKKLILDDKKNSRLYMTLAECYIKLGKKQSAIDTLEELQRVNPKARPLNELNKLNELLANK